MGMIARYLVFAVAVILACAVRAASPASDLATGEDLAILRVLLHCEAEPEHYDVLSDVPLQADANQVPPEWRLGDLRGEIARRSEAICTLRWPPLADCANARVEDETRIKTIFDGQYRVPASWEPFRAEYPGVRGLRRASLPVYTADGDRAIVFSDLTCDPSCGSGFVFEL
jgi:hypothetical protein